MYVSLVCNTSAIKWTSPESKLFIFRLVQIDVFTECLKSRMKYEDKNHN